MDQTPAPKKPRGRILTKLVIFMLLIALVPLIIAALSIRTFNDLHQREIEERQEEVIKQIGNAFEKELAKITAVLSSPPDAADRTLQAEALVRALPGIELLFFADENGWAEFAYSPSYRLPEIPQNFRQLAIFRGVRADRQPRFSALRSAIGGPQLTVAVPAASPHGAPGGALLAVVNLKDMLAEIVSDNENERAGYVFLTNHEGRLLAHNRRDVTVPVSLRTSPLVGSLLYAENIKTEGQKRYESFWREPVVGSGRLRGADGMAQGMGVFVELPTAEADFIFGQLIERFSLITLLLIVLVALLSFYLAMTILRPVRELERGTQRVAQGQFDQPVEVKTGDELEGLGAAFNTMMKGLRELAELREEFVFLATHELKTPVGIIKGYITLLMEGMSGPVSAPVQEQLQKIKAANERLVQLITDLLEVAREEAGRLEIKVEPVQIVESVQKVLAEVERLAKEKEIRLNYAPANLPQVMADSGRIGEIMMNLVGNAIKYTPNGGTVAITHEVAHDQMVTHVSDNGYGISPEAQKKLFEKFYRVKTDKTKDIQGTGLGLFIARKIIEKMGGTIWVESQEGRGSTFSFTLPLAK